MVNNHGDRTSLTSMVPMRLAEVVLTFLSFEFDRVYQLKRCCFYFGSGVLDTSFEEMERWKDLIHLGVKVSYHKTPNGMKLIFPDFSAFEVKWLELKVSGPIYSDPSAPVDNSPLTWRVSPRQNAPNKSNQVLKGVILANLFLKSPYKSTKTSSISEDELFHHGSTVSWPPPCVKSSTQKGAF